MDKGPAEPRLVELVDVFGEDEFVGPPPSSMEEFGKLETDAKKRQSRSTKKHVHPRATEMAGASAIVGPSSPRVMSPVEYTPAAPSNTPSGRPKRGRPQASRRLLQQLEQVNNNPASPNQPQAVGQQHQQHVHPPDSGIFIPSRPVQRARFNRYSAPPPPSQAFTSPPRGPLMVVRPLPAPVFLEGHQQPPAHQSWTTQNMQTRPPPPTLTPQPNKPPPPLNQPANPMTSPCILPSHIMIPTSTTTNNQPLPAHSASTTHLAQTIAASISSQRFRKHLNPRSSIRMPQVAHNNITAPTANPLAIPLLTNNNQVPQNNHNFPVNAQPVRTAYQDFFRQFSANLPSELLQNLANYGNSNAGLDMLAIQNFTNSWVLPSNDPPPQQPITNIVNDIINQQTKTLQAVQTKRPVTPSEDDMAKQDLDAGADKDEEYHEVETYADYAPRKLKIGQPHPDPVVETSSLSTVEPPDVSYQLSLPAKVIEKGYLSALQLETVIYVCQQHQEMFIDGKTRKGFLIGDGAGVGKGRTIAGIIYENFLCGRKKAIWISVSSDLKYDAERDLKDIGAERIPVYLLGKFTYGRKIDVSHGIIFTTYSGLISKSQTIKGHLGSRLGQLINWVGNDFDGNIVFDECHKAKNISMTKNKKTQSKAAEFALEIQKRLPNARVVYASATGASETKHLGYMTRLGIWGPGTPYENFTDFCTAIEKRGVGAMELVAVDLKMRGSYIARQLSFKTTSFEIRIANLDEKFTELYDNCVDLWVKAFKYFDEASNHLLNDKKRSRTLWSSFWGAHQKFFKYLCIGVKVPLVVAIAQEALQNNKCVVIGLQSTGEAKTLEALDEGDINEFVSTAKATFESLLDNHFPVPSSYQRSNPKQPLKVSNSNDSSPGESSKAPSTSGSSTIDESWHSHDVVKFTVENGIVSATLEKDKIDAKLKKASARRSTNDEFKKRFSKNQQALEELAKEKRKSKRVSERTLRAKRRTMNDLKKKSRIRKPIDDSDTDVSTPLSSTSNELPSTSSGSMRNDEDDSDETYEDCVSGSEDLENDGDDDDDDDYESTVVGSDSEMSVKPKRQRPSSSSRQASDSDSDIMYLGAKPKKNNPEVIILSSDAEDDESELDENDPMKIHGKRLCDMKNELLDDVEKLSSALPNNTLDDLINRLGGPSKVAEMTGRKGRVVKDEDGQISYKMRNEEDALDNLNIAEKERFMSGKKLVAIISEAASSGISLQADKRVANTRRRVHITIELPWSADRAIQQFGRTHRSNQLSGPEYVFIISELAGEKRFASIVAKRLESLGALTHGDRRATTDSRDLSQFNIVSRFCKQALELLSRYIEFGHKFANIEPDYQGNFIEDARAAYVGTGLARVQGNIFYPEPIALQINHFLNRILGMKVKIQNALFKLFSEYMERLIMRKKVQGLYDSGILELNSESGKTRCSEPDNYYLKTKSGVVKCTLHYVRVERGISWEYAMELLDTCTKDSRNGFYISTNPLTKVKMVFLLLRETDSVDMFRAYKPNTGKQPKPLNFYLASEKAEKSSPKTAERIWRFVYEETNTKCIHQCFFKSCKRIEARMKCDVGLRHRNYCILSGGILTAWPYLERKAPHMITKLQIVRLKLDSRNRVIGPIIPQDTVERVMKILKAGEQGVEF